LIVLDASAALELLLNTATGKLIAREITNQGVTLHAPHLIDLEIVHTLRRYVLKGAISEAQAQALINYWLQFDVVRYAHEPFIATIWQYRNNLTVYDAAYVALAKILPAILVTCDAALTDITRSDRTINIQCY